MKSKFLNFARKIIFLFDFVLFPISHKQIQSFEFIRQYVSSIYTEFGVLFLCKCFAFSTTFVKLIRSFSNRFVFCVVLIDCFFFWKKSENVRISKWRNDFDYENEVCEQWEGLVLWPLYWKSAKASENVELPRNNFPTDPIYFDFFLSFAKNLYINCKKNC